MYIDNTKIVNNSTGKGFNLILFYEVTMNKSLSYTNIVLYTFFGVFILIIIFTNITSIYLIFEVKKIN
jgi:hypothetical protein